jgi:hypothetical protein
MLFYDKWAAGRKAAAEAAAAEAAIPESAPAPTPAIPEPPDADWDKDELELISRIQDDAVRDEVIAFKNILGGRLSEAGPAGKFTSAAGCQARMLNELLEEQGVLGQPGRITPETVRHGERRRT